MIENLSHISDKESDIHEPKIRFDYIDFSVSNSIGFFKQEYYVFTINIDFRSKYDNYIKYFRLS